jgi:O-antigen/teichoic acid export membrane protein
VKELIGPSLLFGLITLSQAIATQSPVVLISTQLGGAAVAVFVTSRTVSNIARQIAAMVGSALWPHVTALEARGEQAVLRALHRVWVMGSSALCVSIAAALWFEGTDVVRIWTRGKIEADPLLLRLLLLQVVLQAPWLASSLFPAASNQHKLLSYAYLGSSVTGLTLMLLLLRPLGLWAVPTGLIGGELLMCYHFVIRDTCTKLGEAYRDFALRQWGCLACLMLVGLLTAGATHRAASGPALLRWLLVGSASVSGSVAVLWFVGFRGSDRALVIHESRRLLRLKGSFAGQADQDPAAQLLGTVENPG